jgi:hypothetical protein
MFKKILTLSIILFLVGISVRLFAQSSLSKIGTSDYDRCNAYNSGSNIDRNLNGDVMALWATGAAHNYSVLWSKYDELFGVWDPPGVLMAGVDDCRTTKIMADDAGNFHAAFMVNDLTYYAKYDGTSWSTPILVQKDSLSSKVNSLLVDSNGYIWITWDTDPAPDSDEWLFVTHSEDGGTTWPSAPDTLGLPNLVPVVLSTYTLPALAAGPNGEVGVVYRERDSNHSNHYGQYFQEWDGTEWSDPELITTYSDTNAFSYQDTTANGADTTIYYGVDCYAASLVYDSNGKKHVTMHTDSRDWFGDYGINDRSKAKEFYFYHDGTGWTDPVPISTEIDGSVTYGVLRIDANDNLYAAWASDATTDTVGGRQSAHFYYTTSTDGGATWAAQTMLCTNMHYNSIEGINFRSPNLSRHIWDAGVGGTSFDGGLDCMWFEEDTTLTTGDEYQIYYGRIPLVTTGVEDRTSHNYPYKFELEQNYPNPFNPSTTIDYSIPYNGRVYLTIYNLLGQEISTLINKNMIAGIHNITWDGTDNHGRLVPSGIYFYKLELKNQIKTRKLLLLK